jgi:ABC-type amino acid transport substrate-binding protein
LQIAKYTLLIIGALLATTGCGTKEDEAPDAFESMRKHKQVSIATDARSSPFEFGAGTSVQGLDVDIGNEIAKDLGYEAKWNHIAGYEHLFELLKNGEVEFIISAIAVDPKKSDSFAFSAPYYETGDVIVRQRRKFETKGLSDLSGKTVGVCSGRPADAFLESRSADSGITIKRYPTLDDALGALNRTELDAVVGDQMIVNYSSLKSYTYTTPLPDAVNEYQYAVVVRKKDGQLLESINKTINRLEESGELEAFKKKWFEDVLDQVAARREKDLKEEALSKSPKTINVTITKLAGAWDMDRLEGFTIVLEGKGGTFESDYIRTEGNRGRCRFKTPVPPGEYELIIKILKMRAKIPPVPQEPKNSLAMSLKIGRDITVDWK